MSKMLGTTLAVVLWLLPCWIPSQAAGQVSPAATLTAQLSTAPQLSDNQGAKWRIGYYQGGHYKSYFDHMKATVTALISIGWIAEQPRLPSSISDTRSLWHWLGRHAKSDSLEFVEDGYYSADWQTEQRHALSEQLIKRLNSAQGFDLMLAMGTWAGKDLTNNQHQTPTLVISTSDPIEAGIITDPLYSGYPHIHVHHDPYRFERQIRLFHQLIDFDVVGIAYENTVNGRSYAAVDVVEEVAEEQGFAVEHCYTQSDIADQERVNASVIDCFEKLVMSVDAIYITAQGGVNDQTTPTLVDIANRYHVPTFSQAGQEEVRQGYLLSMAPPAADAVGRFIASTLTQVLNGTQAGSINQVFEEPANIVINLKTAELIGLYVDADLIAAADKIYWTIESNKQESNKQESNKPESNQQETQKQEFQNRKSPKAVSPEQTFLNSEAQDLELQNPNARNSASAAQ